MRTASLDRAFTLVLLALGLFIVQRSWSYGLYMNGVPGPGFFPIIAGAIMAVLAAALLARDLSGRQRVAGRIEPSVMLAIAAVTVAIVLVVFVTPLVGMGVATFLAIVAIGWVTEEPHRRGRGFLIKLIFASALVVALCHVLFAYVIGTPLETGPLGI